MTISELYDSVAQLGFETSLEDNDRFILAANRAIKQINRIRPAESTYSLHHFPLENKLNYNTFDPIKKGNEEVIFISNNIKSYYFECNGNGTASIERQVNEDLWETIKTIQLSSVDKRFISYRGKILIGDKPFLGAIKLKFEGAYQYFIKNLALYDELISENDIDVPVYGKFKEYNCAKLINDYLSLTNIPIRNLVFNRDYFIEGKNKILLPINIKGVYDVNYERKVKSLSLDSEDDIDLDDELSALMPLLIASYIWADDEPSKAEYYLTLYREQVAEIRSKEINFSKIICVNRNRW